MNKINKPRDKSVGINPELHKRLKEYCEKNNIVLKGLTEDLIKNYLEENDAKNC